LTAIAAVGANGVIGDGRGLLWHIPEDFARFKAVTSGGVLIMGRRTYESLGGALVQRVSIVLTRDRLWRASNTRGEQVLVASSVRQTAALLAQHTDKRWWVAGGGEIYRQWWPYTTDLDITAVAASPDGSVTFPSIDSRHWRLASRRLREGFAFETYRRSSSDAALALASLIGHAS
jgi:dihydrofolate reductase